MIKKEIHDQIGIVSLNHPEKLNALSLSPLSIEVIKAQFRILSNAQALSADIFERIEGLRKKVWESNDYHEGIKAFHEKRRPHFTGK
ncbi:MAG: hypothetical protein ISS17_06900 [Bacteroidales bacterium]|nr:hypothetical protein [Bacteroidales bacterium]